MFSKDQLFALPASLRDEVEQVIRRAEGAPKEAQLAEKDVKYLRELLRLERIKKCGPASEKLSRA